MAELIAIKALEHASKNSYAVPAFNVYNIETINAILESAQQLQSPVILALSPSTIKHIGFNLVHALVKHKEWRSENKIIMHLDHGHNIGFIKECIDIGFDSVMIDMSTENLQTNIVETKKIVDYAINKKTAIEAELGCVGGFNAGTKTVVKSNWYTDPEVAQQFIKATGIDFLAVAIGSQHGPYKTAPILDITRLKHIKNNTNIPLVLHGASGLSAAQLKEVIKSGISKINIATDLKIAFTNAIKEYLEHNPKEIDLRRYLRLGQQAVTEIANNKIKLFGSQGKSCLL
ncbi:class II fructose-bisphosphate aldolase [Clostridium sp. 'deep sea']|uniref:class II fructose-bisphosphate aldolase n=1 Tax=Clostridium sp. 'deep sea' TaxID=2779445 RepID=UPI0018965F5D|nr:class II fructose-bisphosphate aldolase [Clostridium sp. 'deep sea']QOR34174.1 class II fructose-bisphosphate aldolase [Clostridium sp. 'deep sea']